MSAPPARAMRALRTASYAPPPADEPAAAVFDAAAAPVLRAPRPAPAPPSARRPLDRVVALQSADGSWDLGAALAKAIGAGLAELEAALAGAEGDAALVRRAWATALALAWLERHAADAAEEWRLLADKAAAWLDRCAVRPPAGGDWRSLAAERLAPPR